MAKPPAIIRRPWGKELVLLRSGSFWVKEIFIKDGHRASLQSHKGRDETWVALGGKSGAVIGNKKIYLKPGDIINIKRGQKHRWFGIKKSHILEIAFGKLNERDIFRYQDDYGRASKY